MAVFNCKLVILICAMIMAVMMVITVDASGDHHQQQHILAWISTTSTSTRSPCKGSIAECLIEEEEFEVDSEISRRILQTTRYISYGALQRNTVPCSRRGASYYNCQPGAQANPYSRGCSRITRYSSSSVFQMGLWEDGEWQWNLLWRIRPFGREVVEESALMQL
ncbi:hypothetical protein REPUB_Repub06bG0013500 [Reevesia pubescens]